MAIPVSLDAKVKACIALVCLSPFVIVFIAGCEHTQNTYADSLNLQSPAATGARSDSVPRSSKRRTVLAGPTALYYMYKSHLAASGKGITGRYYRSDRGEVYYLDDNGKHRQVTAPVSGIQLAPEEAAQIAREARQNGFW